MGDSEVIIRHAKKEDMPAVADLIQELANYLKMPNGPKITAEALQRDGFESTIPAFNCLVAEYLSQEEKSIVGYAIYFHTYSTWEGRAMMLEDLYVASNERYHGVGDKIFNAVAKEAVCSGCSRLDFHILEWNITKTLAENRGAINLTSTEKWCYYRLTGEALQIAAKNA